MLAVLCGIPARAVELEPAYVRTVFDQTNGLPTDEANAVLQTRDGYLWVGSYGGLLRFDGSEFHNFSTEGTIATPSIRCLFEDSAGRLWCAVSTGKCAVMQDDRVLAMLDAELFFEDGSVISCLT